MKYSTYGELLHKINIWQSDIIEATERLVELKSDFEVYIADRTIPLDTRYQFWEFSPDCLKNQKSCIQNLELDGTEIYWFDAPLYENRGADILMTNLFDRLSEEPDIYPEDAVNALKEEILEKNLHSFTLDW